MNIDDHMRLRLANMMRKHEDFIRKDFPKNFGRDLATVIKDFACFAARNDCSNAMAGDESGYYIQEQWELYTEGKRGVLIS